MKQDFFSLFGLPISFELDVAELERAYRQVQTQIHPDKFATATPAEKRVAMQWATLANEAYQTLKSPVRRARYLCELHGVDLQVESNTAMPTAFLMQQMAWREQLDTAGSDARELEKLAAQLAQERQQALSEVSALLADGRYSATAEILRQLMFIDKVASEVADALAYIE